MTKTLFWAARRHLGILIRRAHIALGRPLLTREMAEWGYAGQPRKSWHLNNIRRHCQDWGYRKVGRTREGYLWAPPPEDEDGEN